MHQIITVIGLVGLLLGALPTAWGQGRTLRLTFDPLLADTNRPPGAGVLADHYLELGVGIVVNSWRGPGFILRWPGGLLFPDNGTPFLQPWQGDVFFSYRSATTRFDAVSVDLALYSATNLEPVTVQFVAWGYSLPFATTRFTVTANVDSQGRPTFQTFYFPPEFRNMLYLQVSPMPLWSLDNLVIYVPEPSPWALLVLGAGGLSFWSVRRGVNRKGAGRSLRSCRFR